MIDINLKGMGVALITPFKEDDSVDYEALGRLVDYLIHNGADYLVVLGTTAETPTLTENEKNAIIKLVVEKVNRRIPIVLGVGGNCTWAIVEKLKNDNFEGIDAILSVCPYYNKPSQEGLYQHYKAIAKGTFCPPHGFIDTNIERDPNDRKKFRATDREDRGKKALTEYTVEKILSGYALVDIHLHTGRTHQIRVHLSSTGHPILGDPVYGVNDPRYPDSTLMLHAFSLEINHPETGERMHFESELPERFKRILPILEGV